MRETKWPADYRFSLKHECKRRGGRWQGMKRMSVDVDEVNTKVSKKWALASYFDKYCYIVIGQTESSYLYPSVISPWVFWLYLRCENIFEPMSFSFLNQFSLLYSSKDWFCLHCDEFLLCCVMSMRVISAILVMRLKVRSPILNWSIKYLL